MTPCDFTTLNDAGLNLQAILNLDDLPTDITAELRRCYDPENRYRQLILIGHAGKTLWDAVTASGGASENPIDDFSVQTVERWFSAQFADKQGEVIYPGNIAIGLQRLGKIAGWHRESPLMVGIHQEWGTWYAYRLVMLTDTDLAPTPPMQGERPCDRCQDTVCITSCPAGALSGGTFALEKCIGYRKEPLSRCATTCIARVSCPVGSIHRYCDDQIRHCYSISLKAIQQFC
ncbi:hypothetical protein [Aromatoleum diolicum]|uniref:4Fe-4S ferredoxin-type domain-containing protein n=1 Tax=Aromatoleum diolicum TaxID=75796 RepID=A0ABX1QEK5_9RHOO|nr:hypothetical protein [Aromatoleum diolicum]NMG76363.1 hypothetical protein [Aromatoleum diolicum]